MYLIIDIETENTGTDVMEDNKRIISVQIGDDTKQDLYWADSKESKWNLESAKKEIESLLSKGVIFSGHNIKGFDVRFLKEFLGVEITESNIHDPCGCQSQKMTRLTGKNHPTLEQACAVFGIKVTHKTKNESESHQTQIKRRLQKTSVNQSKRVS